MAASSATDKRPGGSGSGCVTCLAHSPLGRHAGTCPYICRGGVRHTLITPGNGDRHRCRIGSCPPLLRLHDVELVALSRAAGRCLAPGLPPIASKTLFSLLLPPSTNLCTAAPPRCARPPSLPETSWRYA